MRPNRDRSRSRARRSSSSSPPRSATRSASRSRRRRCTTRSSTRCPPSTSWTATCVSRSHRASPGRCSSSRSGRCTPVLCVGIGYPANMLEVMALRMRDLTPTAAELPPSPMKTDKYGMGGADRLLDCLVDEVFPLVEERFRSEPTQPHGRRLVARRPLRAAHTLHASADVREVHRRSARRSGGTTARREGGGAVRVFASGPDGQGVRVRRGARGDRSGAYVARRSRTDMTDVRAQRARWCRTSTTWSPSSGRVATRASNSRTRCSTTSTTRRYSRPGSRAV